MRVESVDVVILGAGTAGMAAYRAAVAAGASVRLVEAERYGTTCARVGCMPSKLLIAAAEAAHHVEAAAPFGVHPGLGPDGRVRVDGAEVMDRVRRERDRFVGFVVRAAEGFPEEHRRMGRARFLPTSAPGRLHLAVDHPTDPLEILAKRAVIATGSRPKILPMFDGLGDRLIVNDDVFSWGALPGAVAVFGLGVIGLELGQALHRLGVRTRAFGVGGFVGPLTDPAIKAVAAAAFAAEMPVDFDARVSSLARVGDQVEIRFEEGGAQRTERFDYVLTATGRAPNVDGLGLEHAGVALDRRGVPLYDARTMRCGDSDVWIAGDANADLPLLHEAADEGRIAGDNAARSALGQEAAPGLRRAPLAVVFSDPQLLLIGATHAALTAAGVDFVTGSVSFEDQGRSRVMRVNKGALNVYAARDGRLLGAEGAGPRAEHLAHLLAWSCQQGLTVGQMLEMPFYHPVIEEGLRTALRDAAAKLSSSEISLK